MAVSPPERSAPLDVHGRPAPGRLHPASSCCSFFSLCSFLSSEENSAAYKTAVRGAVNRPEQNKPPESVTKTSPTPGDFWGSLSMARRKIKVEGGVGRTPVPLKKQSCF